MSKKTGKKYYISERPSSAEILDVLDSAVERGLERNGRIVIESYYAHRRSNFIKGYADPELFARVLKRKYNYVMTSKAPGWYDVCMPYKVLIIMQGATHLCSSNIFHIHQNFSTVMKYACIS